MKGKLLFYKSMNSMNKMFVWCIILQMSDFDQIHNSPSKLCKRANPIDNLTLIIANVYYIVNHLEYAWDKSVKYVMWATKYVKSRGKV